MQSSAKVPKFNGDERRWIEFSLEWARYAAYALIGCPEGALGEVFKRVLLINCLSGTLHRRYADMVMRQPSLSYDEIWAELERLLGIDDQHHWRRLWAGTNLRHSGEEIVLRDLLAFENAFEMAKARVSDWTI